MGGGFGPTVALLLLHLHCERGGGREREGEREGVQSVLMFMEICKENSFHCEREGGGRRSLSLCE